MAQSYYIASIFHPYRTSQSLAQIERLALNAMQMSRTSRRLSIASLGIWRRPLFMRMLAASPSAGILRRAIAFRRLAPSRLISRLAASRRRHAPHDDGPRSIGDEPQPPDETALGKTGRANSAYSDLMKCPPLT